MKDNTLGYMTVTTIFSAEVAAALPPKVMTAITDFNANHVEKNSHKGSWISRAAIFKKLDSEIQRCSS